MGKGDNGHFYFLGGVEATTGKIPKPTNHTTSAKMSDSMRQDTTDKIKSNVKPDSEKSTLEKGSESIKGTADSVAGKAQPDSEKSAGQSVTDTVSGGSKDAQNQGSSLLNQASEGLSNAATQAQDALGMGKK